LELERLLDLGLIEELPAPGDDWRDMETFILPDYFKITPNGEKYV
jgi:hypothetical protein